MKQYNSLVKVLVVIVFEMLSKTGYSQHIKANFTFQLDSSGCSAFKFTNTSTGTITSSTWNFGDASMSTEMNPMHTYTIGIGTQRFQVRLQVICIDTVNSIFENDTITKTVTITTCDTCHIVASIELEGDSSKAYTGTLYNNSTGTINKELWDFGDNSISHLHTPTHLYANPGVYTITYIAYDTLNGCNRNTSVTFTIDSMGYVKRKAFLLTVVDGKQLGITNMHVSAASVYPNPSTGLIYIRTTNNQLISKMNLLSSDGKLIYTGEFANNLDMSSFSKGIYFLELIGEKQHQYLKVIKS